MPSAIQPGRDRRADARRGPAPGPRQPERRPGPARKPRPRKRRWTSRRSCWACGCRACWATWPGWPNTLAMIEKGHPAMAGQALAEAAEGMARSKGPALAVSMLANAPGVDFQDPRYAAALRALVRYSHQAGEPAAIRAGFQKILAAHPDSSVFQEIRGLELELSGAPAEAVSAAYQRALELGPGNAQALAGLGRLALGNDPEAALGFFDRAAAADPSDPDLKLGAARALVASGKPAEAEQRLDALLVEHPFEAEAAAERARLDLERGVATPQTLDRARRAVLFRRRGRCARAAQPGPHPTRRDRARGARDGAGASAARGRLREQGLSRRPTGASGNSFPSQRKMVSRSSTRTPAPKPAVSSQTIDLTLISKNAAGDRREGTKIALCKARRSAPGICFTKA